MFFELVGKDSKPISEWLRFVRIEFLSETFAKLDSSYWIELMKKTADFIYNCRSSGYNILLNIEELMKNNLCIISFA